MVIDTTLYAEMIRSVRDAFPEEACGILATKDGIAQRVYPIANVSESPVIFTMDSEQQLQAMLEIEDREWDLGAVYHSHPRTRAYPSETDLKLARYPEALQIIISLAAGPDNPDVHGFRIVDGQVSEESIEIV